jgi:hypothetical protein
MPRCTAAASFASIRLDQGLASGAASHAGAYTLEYVPCPAHNPVLNRAGKKPPTACCSPSSKHYSRNTMRIDDSMDEIITQHAIFKIMDNNIIPCECGGYRKIIQNKNTGVDHRFGH